MIELEKELLEVHVTLAKLKLARKSILKDAAILGIIAIVIIALAAFGSISEWTEFPIFQAAIAAGGILLAIAFRPLQQYTQEFAATEEKRKDLEMILKKDHLEYEVDVRVRRDKKGEFDIKKNIKIVTIK